MHKVFSKLFVSFAFLCLLFERLDEVEGVESDYCLISEEVVGRILRDMSR